MKAQKEPKLTDVEGVGRNLSKKLVEAGVPSVSALASLTAADVEHMIGHIGSKRATVIVSSARLIAGSPEKDDVVDLEDIPIPSAAERPPSEWAPLERRAAILRTVREKGSPDLLNINALARFFDKNWKVVSHDLKYVKRYIKSRIGRDAHEKTESAYDWCLRTALESKDPNTVLRTLDGWNKWLYGVGKIELRPAGLSVEQRSVNLSAEDLSDEQVEDMVRKLTGRSE